MRPGSVALTALVAALFVAVQQPAEHSGMQGLSRDELTVIAGGDVMAQAEQLRKTYNRRTGRYDFQYSLAPIREIVANADLSFANLETVLAGRDAGYSGYPRCNTPIELAEALRFAGFKVVTTANNHCMDRGKAGLLKTIKALDQVGLVHTGTFASQADRDRPTVINCKGYRIGVIACTFGTNGISVPDDYLVNRLDSAILARDAAAARAAGAEVVIACIHWGVEYQRQPTPAQRNQAREIISSGVDIILGSHPHVVEPIDIVLTGAGRRKRRGLVCYSMGNLVSTQRNGHRDEGVLIRITLSRDRLYGAQISRYSYIPTYIDSSGTFGARVYPADFSLPKDARSTELGQKLRAARANTTELLGQTR